MYRIHNNKSGSLKHFGALLVFIGCVGVAPAPPGWDTNPSLAGMFVRVGLYDTSGNSGIVYDKYRYDDLMLYMGGSIEIYLANYPGEPVRIDDWWAQSLNLDEPQAVPGDAWFAKVSHPLFGCMTTGGYLGINYGMHQDKIFPRLIIPVDFTDTGLHGWRFDRGVSHENDVKINIAVEVGDSRSTPTLAVPFAYFDDDPAENPATLLIEYLDGNELEGSGLSIHFDRMTTSEPPQFQTITVHWGEPEPDEESMPHSFPFVYGGGDIPAGPVRLTFGADGYSSDTVLMTFQDEWIYDWNPLLVPLGEERIGDLFPSPSLMELGISTNLLEDCPPTAGISGAYDPNRDGINDAADIAATRPTLNFP